MTRRKKIRVGVLFGGRSGEHEISLRSALTIISAMDPKHYEVVPIGVARDGKWYLRNDAVAELRTAAPRLQALGRGGIQVSLPPNPGRHTLIPIEAKNGDVRAARRNHREMPGPLDVIFPVLHGTYGEDGTIQGLLELAEIPFVGPGVLGSAIGMDKDAQKRLFRDAGIPVVRFFSITRTALEHDPELAARRADDLGYPIFVKPNALGSSIGIARVATRRELARALNDAFQYDRKVLLEASCAGREFECAVLGNDDPQASLPGEVIVKGRHDFYSYESKYVDAAGSEVCIPADLPPGVTERIRKLSVAAFEVLSLRGMARVDFLASPDLSELVINEVNTIPGFTAISMYPKMWEATGLPLPRLVERLIDLAIEDHRARAQLKYIYNPESRSGSGSPRSRV
jgi:D-alanine-D-alanine ligase